MWEVKMKVQPPTPRFTMTKRPNLDAFIDENLCKNIITNNLEWKAKKMTVLKEKKQKLKANKLKCLKT